MFHHIINSMAYGTKRFNLALTSPTNPIARIEDSFRNMSSQLRLGLPKGIFPVTVPVTIFKELLPSSILATWLPHLNLLYLITLTILGERYKLWSCSLWILLHSSFVSHFGPNIRLRILFSNTLSQRSSLNVPYANPISFISCYQ